MVHRAALLHRGLAAALQHAVTRQQTHTLCNHRPQTDACLCFDRQMQLAAGAESPALLYFNAGDSVKSRDLAPGPAGAQRRCLYNRPGLRSPGKQALQAPRMLRYRMQLTHSMCVGNVGGAGGFLGKWRLRCSNKNLCKNSGPNPGWAGRKSWKGRPGR